MHELMGLDSRDIARHMQDLLSRVGGLSLEGSREGDRLDHLYAAFDDAADISNYYLGSTANPFENDDIKYIFDVYSLAIGCMDGRQLNFYEARILNPSHQNI